MALFEVYTILLPILSLIYIVNGQCSWDGINLGTLSGTTVQCAFDNYEILYSPCRDDMSCSSAGLGAKFMAVQDDTGESSCSAYLAKVKC